MGWLSLRHGLHRRRSFEAHTATTTNAKSQLENVEQVEHVEDLLSTSKTFPLRQHVLNYEYPFEDPTLSDEALPFIPPTVVRAQHLESDTSIENSRKWIVIDSIVYDCTKFIHEHPGGATVIRSFLGEDCSWQFWRFHSRSTMNDFGRPLRIGRTEGIENRFKEPPRYIGWSRLKSAK